MPGRNPIPAVALTVALLLPSGGAQALTRFILIGAAAGSGEFDPSKPRGLGQQAPLTPEYQKILEASVADQAHGGQGNDPGHRCNIHGMPRS